METLLAALAIGAFLLWRVRRWPLTACWCCGGAGKHTKGRRARPCRWCGGRGWWVRPTAKKRTRKR